MRENKLGVALSLLFIGIFFIGCVIAFAVQGEDDVAIGERAQYGCFQYGDQEYCEVWVNTYNGWALCYRTVPASIPPEDINCHE